MRAVGALPTYVFVVLPRRRGLAEVAALSTASALITTPHYWGLNSVLFFVIWAEVRREEMVLGGEVEKGS